jgi:hypothetical protein
VPHFVEGLGNVEECSGAVLLGFEGRLDLLDDTVGLVDGRMSLSEAKLVSGDETVGGNQWEETV